MGLRPRARFARAWSSAIIHSLNRGFGVRNPYVQNMPWSQLSITRTIYPSPSTATCTPSKHQTHSPKLRLLLVVNIKTENILIQGFNLERNKFFEASLSDTLSRSNQLQSRLIPNDVTFSFTSLLTCSYRSESKGHKTNSHILQPSEAYSPEAGEGGGGNSIVFHLSFLTHSACQYDVTY